jgi:hypothetical protein
MSEFEGEGRPRYAHGVIAKYNAALLTIIRGSSDSDTVG